MIPPQEDLSIKSGLRASLVFHVILFSFFILKSVFFTTEAIDYQAAVRVDLVGLPDKLETQTLPPAAKEVAKPQPIASAIPAPTPVPTPALSPPPTPRKLPEKKIEKKDPEAINLDKTKAIAKEKAALNKLKAMAALDKIKDEVAKEKPKDDGSVKNKVGDKKIKGNVLSPGSALTGLAKLQHDTYLADLDSHIKKNWSLPEWLAKKDYTAQVRLRIDERGNILSRQIIKTSGNSSYDAEVLATVDRSAPFPAPPEKFISIVEVDGILIGFPE